MKIEHHVEILYPGSFYPEEYTYKISRRETSEVYKHAKPGMFCFSYYDVEVRSGKLEDGELITDHKIVNKSGRFYPGGTLLNLTEVKLLGPDFRILASNMECNGWKVIVKTRRGNFQPFEEGRDTILSDMATPSAKEGE